MSQKTVFFTDLDRTLIYSKKFLSEQIDSVLVEKKGEKGISYMTKKAYSLLKEVKKETLLIPVSTRTWETMTRIDFIQQELPSFMVCDNGAHIYVNGKLLKDWEDYINQKKQTHALPVSSLEQKLRISLEDSGLKEISNRDNVYLVAKFEEMTGEVRQTLEALHLQLREKGYRIDVNSRKAYILPDYVTKESAVSYLIENYHFQKTISAGDSLMDLGMLRATCHSIAPAHKSFPETFMQVTNHKGMKAGEEILQFVYNLCSTI